MNRLSIWAGILMLALCAGPAAFASPPEVELRMVLQVHTGDAVRSDMTTQQSEEVRKEALDQTVRSIRSRLDQLGVADPVIEVQPGDRISIRLPDVEDSERVSRLIRSSALFEFRFVGFPAGGGGVDSRDDILQHYGGQLPADLEILEGDVRGENGAVTGTKYYAVETRRVVTGRDFKNARSSLGQFGNPIVEFTLQPEATEAFGEATGSHIGSGLAIVLNGRVVSAPMIRSRIGGGTGMIEGKFTQEEVQDLVTVLRSGALPVRVTALEEHAINPSPAALRRKEHLRLIGMAGVLLILLVALGLYWQRRQQRRAA
ncbi:MAG: preprotein translocase subunit SecD [Acidobacteriota bacterium]|jgi:preprotein translocase subunit SecD|nr:preprotein translocase subunit SecD [Acidobacteriota bacterium]